MLQISSHSKTKALFIACLLLASSHIVLAQVNLPIPDVPSLIDLESSIYGVMLIILGYLSKKIPFVNKIPSTAWRVVTIAIVIGIIIIAFGWSNVQQLVFSYISATKLYELVLRFFLGKSKELDV